MSILILGGAGLMGAGTIRDLLSSGVKRIVAADLGGLERLPDDPRLERVKLDVADPEALTALLEDCQICINGVPTFAGFQMFIFEACLAARRTYVDYGGMGVFTVKQKAFHDRFAQAGVTAVIGLGADPGMSNVLCRACADRLDKIESIHLYWAATLLGPENPVLVPTYSVSTVLSEFANPSLQFVDGELREMPPRSGVEVLDLPEPWGATRFMFSQHSEPLTVPFARGIAEKGIRQFTWRLSLPAAEHQTWEALVRAGFGDYDTPVTVPGGTVRPLDVLQAVIARHAASHRERIPQQESHEIHFAVARGTRMAQPVRVTAQVIGHPHDLYEGYADAATSMNMSIAVQQILARPLVPGVWAPEEYFEPEAYLEEVRRRHFEVSIRSVPEEAPGGPLLV